MVSLRMVLLMKEPLMTVHSKMALLKTILSKKIPPKKALLWSYDILPLAYLTLGNEA